eukprot:536931-Amphidinium_carterae.1
MARVHGMEACMRGASYLTLVASFVLGSWSPLVLPALSLPTLLLLTVFIHVGSAHHHMLTDKVIGVYGIQTEFC